MITPEQPMQKEEQKTKKFFLGSQSLLNVIGHQCSANPQLSDSKLKMVKMSNEKDL
jgi:hypothetical protein